jgi:hypothetical protein
MGSRHTDLVKTSLRLLDGGRRRLQAIGDPPDGVLHRVACGRVVERPSAVAQQDYRPGDPAWVHGRRVLEAFGQPEQRFPPWQHRAPVYRHRGAEARRGGKLGFSDQTPQRARHATPGHGIRQLTRPQCPVQECLGGETVGQLAVEAAAMDVHADPERQSLGHATSREDSAAADRRIVDVLLDVLHLSEAARSDSIPVEAKPAGVNILYRSGRRPSRFREDGRADRLATARGADYASPCMPRRRQLYSSSTRVLSIAMIVIGVALIVRTLVAGGGAIATGIVLGILFVLAGAARLYLQLRG